MQEMPALKPLRIGSWTIGGLLTAAFSQVVVADELRIGGEPILPVSPQQRSFCFEMGTAGVSHQFQRAGPLCARLRPLIERCECAESLRSDSMPVVPEREVPRRLGGAQFDRDRFIRAKK